MNRNLGALVLAALLGISKPSVANHSGIVDRSSILELANLALHCGQRRRVEARDGNYPYYPYLADEYILQLNDGSGVQLIFRDGSYDPFSRRYNHPNGIVDDDDSVSYVLEDLSGFCRIEYGCRDGVFPFPYRNERAAESVERLKKSVSPRCLNPNVC